MWPQWAAATCGSGPTVEKGLCRPLINAIVKGMNSSVRKLLDQHMQSGLATNSVVIDGQAIADYYLHMVEDGQKFSPWKLPCLRSPWDDYVICASIDGRPALFYCARTSIADGGESLGIQMHGKSGPMFTFILDILPDGSMNPDKRIFGWDEGTARSMPASSTLADLALVMPALLAISFFHVKGSKLIEIDPQHAQVQLNNTFRSKKSRPLPLYSHHVLVVDPIDRVLRQIEHSRSSGVRLHLVRGHFKDCREHGIAGNQNAKGIYWWQPHVRGDKKLGMVDKEYAAGDAEVIT